MAKAQYRLVMRQGPVPGQVFELTREAVNIGRDIANDLVINDAEVSRKHAKMTLEGDRYTIEDLNSTNGTYIDGQRLIGPHVMAIGEIIMFGDNVGVVYDGEPATPDSASMQPERLGDTPVAAIPAPVEDYIPPIVPTPDLTHIPPTAMAAGEQLLEPPQEEAQKPINSWLLAGGGCLVVIILLVIAVLVFIDQPWKANGGLYCVQPFAIFFQWLGFCP